MSFHRNTNPSLQYDEKHDDRGPFANQSFGNVNERSRRQRSQSYAVDWRENLDGSYVGNEDFQHAHHQRDRSFSQGYESARANRSFSVDKRFFAKKRNGKPGFGTGWLAAGLDGSAADNNRSQGGQRVQQHSQVQQAIQVLVQGTHPYRQNNGDRFFGDRFTQDLLRYQQLGGIDHAAGLDGSGAVENSIPQGGQCVEPPSKLLERAIQCVAQDGLSKHHKNGNLVLGQNNIRRNAGKNRITPLVQAHQRNEYDFGKLPDFNRVFEQRDGQLFMGDFSVCQDESSFSEHKEVYPLLRALQSGDTSLLLSNQASEQSFQNAQQGMQSSQQFSQSYHQDDGSFHQAIRGIQYANQSFLLGDESHGKSDGTRPSHNPSMSQDDSNALTHQNTPHNNKLNGKKKNGGSGKPGFETGLHAAELDKSQIANQSFHNHSSHAQQNVSEHKNKKNRNKSKKNRRIKNNVDCSILENDPNTTGQSSSVANPGDSSSVAILNQSEKQGNGMNGYARNGGSMQGAGGKGGRGGRGRRGRGGGSRGGGAVSHDSVDLDKSFVAQKVTQKGIFGHGSPIAEYKKGINSPQTKYVVKASLRSKRVLQGHSGSVVDIPSSSSNSNQHLEDDVLGVNHQLKQSAPRKARHRGPQPFNVELNWKDDRMNECLLPHGSANPNSSGMPFNPNQSITGYPQGFLQQDHLNQTVGGYSQETVDQVSLNQTFGGYPQGIVKLTKNDIPKKVTWNKTPTPIQRKDPSRLAIFHRRYPKQDKTLEPEKDIQHESELDALPADPQEILDQDVADMYPERELLLRNRGSTTLVNLVAIPHGTDDDMPNVGHYMALGGIASVMPDLLVWGNECYFYFPKTTKLLMMPPEFAFNLYPNLRLHEKNEVFTGLYTYLEDDKNDAIGRLMSRLGSGTTLHNWYTQFNRSESMVNRAAFVVPKKGRGVVTPNTEMFKPNVSLPQSEPSAVLGTVQPVKKTMHPLLLPPQVKAGRPEHARPPRRVGPLHDFSPLCAMPSIGPQNSNSTNPLQQQSPSAATALVPHPDNVTPMNAYFKPSKNSTSRKYINQFFNGEEGIEGKSRLRDSDSHQDSTNTLDYFATPTGHGKYVKPHGWDLFDNSSCAATKFAGADEEKSQDGVESKVDGTAESTPSPDV